MTSKQRNKMSKNCIISFANSKSRYVAGVARLSESLRNNFDGTFLAFIGEETIGAPLHSVVPYAFKVYAFRKAIESGFENILYVDSSCFAIQNVQPCFDEIERDGFLFQNAGHLASTWINDFSLNYFGYTREQASEIRLIGNAGMLGLSVNNKLAMDFLNRWEESMLDGCFNGEWTNSSGSESEDAECLGHRHDMVSGVILHKMGLSHLMKAGDEWLQYAGPYDKTANETIIFKAQGL